MTREEGLLVAVVCVVVLSVLILAWSAVAP